MSDRILFVDDDPNILAAYQRQLRRRLNIDVAPDAETALRMLKNEGPYAIIVTDLHMPRTDGIQLLVKAREIAPQTIRIMLSGSPDQRSAIEAINEGHIFRFLTKPCLPDAFARAIEAGLTQYALVMAERELLEKTLTSSVGVLTETLSLVNPAAFGRATRLKRYVRHVARQLKLENPWQMEVAAMLSQIGCVTLASETLEKVYAGEELTVEERAAYETHPMVGSRLLSTIPRLEDVSQMIARQNEAYTEEESAASYREDPVTTGARLLRIALDFDDRLFRGKPADAALLEMTQRRQHHPTLLAALENIRLGERDLEPRMVRVNELRLRMQLDADVRSRHGMLLVARGQEVTPSVLECLKNFAGRVGIMEPIKVLVPRLAALDDDADADLSDATEDGSGSDAFDSASDGADASAA